MNLTPERLAEIQRGMQETADSVLGDRAKSQQLKNTVDSSSWVGSLINKNKIKAYADSQNNLQNACQGLADEVKGLWGAITGSTLNKVKESQKATLTRATERLKAVTKQKEDSLTSFLDEINKASPPPEGDNSWDDMVNLANELVNGTAQQTDLISQALINMGLTPDQASKYSLYGTALFPAWLMPPSFVAGVIENGGSIAGAALLSFPDGNIDGNPEPGMTPEQIKEQKLQFYKARLNRKESYTAGADKAAKDESLPDDTRQAMANSRNNYATQAIDIRAEILKLDPNYNFNT